MNPTSNQHNSPDPAEDDRMMRDLFAGFQPVGAAEPADFMARLNRSLDAVEDVKERTSRSLRINRVAAAIAALAGFITGVITMLVLPLITTTSTAATTVATVTATKTANATNDVLLSLMPTETFLSTVTMWVIAAGATILTAFAAYTISSAILSRPRP